MNKNGTLEIKFITNQDLLDEYMDIYYAVYSKSWQKIESIGPTFHRDFAKLAAQKGWLRLGFLFLDQTPISAQFWITCNSTSYILKTIYDQDYRKYSPGKVLTAEMMKYVIDIDKVTTVDYVQGDEPYKKDWTPKRRERKGLYLFNNNLKGKYLALLTNKIQPTVNRLECLRKVKKLAKKIT